MDKPYKSWVLQNVSHDCQSHIEMKPALAFIRFNVDMVIALYFSGL
jgi:hypothetical protein